MLSPCKDCEKRHMNCHAQCKEYQAYNEENIKRREENRRDIESRSYRYDSRIKNLKKTKWRR